MSRPVLITSFAPWRAHQRSNASDDLLLTLQRQQQLPNHAVLLRHLPVHSQLAPCQVISKIMTTCPAVVVCCGMAEGRSLLTLEKVGRQGQRSLKTTLNLRQVSAGTHWTTISHHAGNYVCNDLYYQVLAFTHRCPWNVESLFIHVPVLTTQNMPWIVADFLIILSQLQVMTQWSNLLKAA